MTERDPMGPERLGELVDGAAPRDEEERALVDLLTETRALEPAAPDALRERVRAQVAQSPPPERRSPFAWWGSADARRRLLIAAPVAAGIAAVAIALPLVTGGDSGAPVGQKRRRRATPPRPCGSPLPRARPPRRGPPRRRRRPVGCRRATPRRSGPTRAGRRR